MTTLTWHVFFYINKICISPLKKSFSSLFSKLACRKPKIFKHRLQTKPSTVTLSPPVNILVRHFCYWNMWYFKQHKQLLSYLICLKKHHKLSQQDQMYRFMLHFSMMGTSNFRQSLRKTAYIFGILKKSRRTQLRNMGTLLHPQNASSRVKKKCNGEFLHESLGHW